jgi:SAM-dependent methyltransferase
MRQGRLLVLGVGTWREAIRFAQMGYEVAGVDFVPEMVRKATENSSRRGLKIEGLVQEISKLTVPKNSCDVIWLSSSMYSSVPTRGRRVEMLHRIRHAVRPEGRVVCQFHVGEGERFSAKASLTRKIAALVTGGNLKYEPGDMLWNRVEFIHAFSSEEEVRSELSEGGVEILYMDASKERMRGGAVLKPRKAS